MKLAAVYLASKLKAFTLFATHYFELTALPESYPQAHNIHLDATEHNDHIVFLHSIQEGPASKSYGLQVAKLAGIPDTVIQAAKSKLISLENNETVNSSTSPVPAPAPSPHCAGSPLQSDMFNSEPHPILSELSEIDPDELTPRAALEALYQLRKMLN